MKKIILSLVAGMILMILALSAHGDEKKHKFMWQFNLVTAKGDIELQENTISYIRGWGCQIWTESGKTAESGTIICTKGEKSLGAFAKCTKNSGHAFDSVFLEKDVALTVTCSNE